MSCENDDPSLVDVDDEKQDLDTAHQASHDSNKNTDGDRLAADKEGPRVKVTDVSGVACLARFINRTSPAADSTSQTNTMQQEEGGRR